MGNLSQHVLVIASICLVLTGCEQNNVQQSPTNTDNQSTVSNSGLKTYDQNGIFLQYADKFIAKTGNDLGGANLDTSLIKVTIPKEMVTSANTNFNEAYLVVSKSTAPKTISTCTAFTETNNTTDTFTTVTLNGTIFTKLRLF